MKNLITKIESSIRPIQWLLKYKTRYVGTNGVYIQIITHSKNRDRQSYALSKWIPLLYNTTVRSEVVFTSDTLVENNLGVRTIIVPKHLTDSESRRIPPIWGTTNFKDVAKTVKFSYGLKDFYYNTTFNWFKYQDDDGAIYVPNFVKMINDFNSKYNPLTDAVVKGCCQTDQKYSRYKRYEVYIQGGTGLVISRATVKFFIDNFEGWYNKMDNFEDRYIMKLINASGVSPVDVSSTYFIGDSLKNPSKDVFKTLNFKNLTICPDVHPQTVCKKEFYQFNKIASFHKYKNYDWIVPLLDQNLIPDNVKFYDHSNEPKLCYKK